MRERIRPYVLPAAGVLVAASVWLPAIPQDPAYHNFADQRTLAGVPHLLNVISNLPFLIVGLLGLWITGKARLIHASERAAWLVLFAGVALTCFGSSYYHLAPGNERLVWDRLPMTIGFMGFFAATLAERVNLKMGTRGLPWLLAFGIASVAYWHFTEQAGRGDLRPYVVVQFVPLLLIPVLVWTHPPRYTRGRDIVIAILIYGGAKVFELFDAQVLAAGSLVSGHSLKHVAAAVGTWWLARMLMLRRPLGALEPASAAVSAG